MSNYETSVLDSAKATQMLKEMLQLGKSTAGSNVTIDLLDRTVSSTNGKQDSKSTLSMIDARQRGENLADSNAVKQELLLNGSDESVSFPIYGSEVTLKCSRSGHSSGSSNVKIRNIVNSGWENKYYIGQQVATHLSKNYIAYAVKLPASPDGAVRVIGRKSQGRVLLRGMKGHVIDLAFSHIVSEVILASVDEFGGAFVHAIKDDGDNLVGTLIFELRRPEHGASSYHRILWCPYIPDDLNPEDDPEPASSDVSKILVLANDNVAEIWNLETVIKEYGAGPHTTDSISVGFQYIKEHTLPISDAAFPPDGTALATVGYDGSIKFFEISTVLDSNTPQKCIHKWGPHNEAPLSCLFFLDNLKHPNLQLQFWKFAITGANKNRELKVWNCSTWECLQTIQFEWTDEDYSKVEIKARLDESAEFLILSDVVHRVIYVLQIFQDPDNNVAQITSISEFHLTYPVLSFDILEIGRKKFKQSPDIYNVEESAFCENSQVEMDDDRKDYESQVDGVVVKLIYIQPKSLQECYIAFQPASSLCESGETVSSVSQDASFKDRLSDVSFETMSSDVPPALEMYNHSKSSLGSSQKLNLSGQILLTPEVFSSPSHDSTTKNDLSLRFSSPKSASKDFEQNLMSLEEITTSIPDSDSQTLAYSKTNGCHSSNMYSPSSDKTIVAVPKQLQSTGSSPSLEVQEILTKSLDDTTQDQVFLVEEESKAPTEFSCDNSEDLINTIMGLDSSIGSTSMHETSVTAAKPLSPLPSCLLDDRSPPTGKLLKWPTAPKVPLHTGQIIVDDKKQRKSSNASNGSEPNSESWALKKTTSQLDMLLQGVQNLSLMMENQQSEILHLKETVTKLETQVETSTSNFNSSKLLNDMNSSVKAMLHKHRQSEGSTLTGLFKSHEERLMSAISQIINNSILGRIDATVKAEFRNSIIPVFTRDLEGLQSKLHTEVVHQLAATDSLMKDNIGKLVESKTFLGGISHAVTASLQGVMRSAFQEVIQLTAVPLIEKLTQNMFQQINDSFQRGTNEFMQHVESCFEKQYTQEQSYMTSQLQTVVENVQLSTEQCTSTLTEKLDKRLHSTLQRFDEQLRTTLCSLVKDEMAVVIKEHKSVIGDTVVNAIKSRAVTPIPTVDPHAQQMHILQLIQQGQLNSAFQQALSAADLSLVTMVCERVNPSQIFNQNPCPLQQPVLLSLIHQLCVDLNSRTELKQEYLQEALVNLDFSNPITLNHASTVIDMLQQKLQQFIDAHPSNKLTRNMKVLLMATQSLPRP